MLSVDAIPHHVAIVMDGNGRWAARRLMPRIAGHKRGVDALRDVVKACATQQVKVLTVFAFSSENWARPEEEVSGLLDLLARALLREVPQLQKDGVQLHFLGDKSPLAPALQQGLQDAQAQTQSNSQLVLNVCFNYGGRWDVVQAAQHVVAQGEALTQESLSAALSTAHCGDPDLVIRTGGEQRISNFLLWQSAYSELYFTDTLWPDFDAHALAQAIAAYASRERRYGRTSAQVTEPSDTSQKR